MLDSIAGTGGEVYISPTARAVAGVANEALQRGWDLFFVTARTDVRDVGDRTVADLERAGYAPNSYRGLYLMPETVWHAGTPTAASIAHYKTCARADIATRYDVSVAVTVGNVFGDGMSLMDAGPAVVSLNHRREHQVLPRGGRVCVRNWRWGDRGVHHLH